MCIVGCDYTTIEMEFCFKICAMLLIKGGKIQITGGIEQIYFERIRGLRDEENHKYLEILEEDTIKQVKMKEKKIKKNISDQRENFLKLSSSAAIS